MISASSKFVGQFVPGNPQLDLRLASEFETRLEWGRISFPALMTITAGTTLGRYEIRSLIGAGGTVSNDVVLIAGPGE